MADILSTLRAWSGTASSNQPQGSTTVGTNVDDNFQTIQAVIKNYVAGAPANMASATTLDLSTATSNYVNVTGTTTITGLGTEASGIPYRLKFAGALTLTHNGTSLILPGAANILTVAGDVIDFVSEGGGNWRCIGFVPQGYAHAPYDFVIPASDETTAITTGLNKVTMRIPRAMIVTGVRASLTTAQTSGSIFTVDINDGGTTILSTKLTIDNGEKTSTTAATPAVISDTALAADAEITIDVDQVGDGTAKGLKVTLIGHL